MKTTRKLKTKFGITNVNVYIALKQRHNNPITMTRHMLYSSQNLIIKSNILSSGLI